MHTGPRAFCFLMALAATGAEAVSAESVVPSAGHYRVEAILVSAPKAAANNFSTDTLNVYYPDDAVGHLLKTPATSVLTCPSFEAKSNTRGTVEVTQKKAFSDGLLHKTGITLTVTPTSHEGTYRIAFENIRFAGFKDATTKQPVFNIQRLSTTMMQFNPPSKGYCCFNIRGIDHSVATYDADGRKSASMADANERELLFVKISRG